MKPAEGRNSSVRSRKVNAESGTIMGKVETLQREVEPLIRKVEINLEISLALFQLSKT